MDTTTFKLSEEDRELVIDFIYCMSNIASTLIQIDEKLDSISGNLSDISSCHFDNK